MKMLLVADVHANLAALEAVLADAAAAGGFDRTWMAGDVVGYGPDPNECVDWVRDADAVAVSGNHDLAAAGAVVKTTWSRARIGKR